MSPAKRKTSKPGRSATAAARGGKARSKARGSALTKAVTVKGKTPAKGRDHRLEARGGARNGVRNGAGIACELPREQLELLLDRDGGRDDVLTHVPACHPCTTSLTVIASQRDAIRHLTAEPGGTAVEYLLERGARAGERKLADLVYELAKACLVVVKDVDRRVHLETRPRKEGEIGREVREAALRVQSVGRRIAASGLPLIRQADASAIVAAESCINILAQLEGASTRQQLAQAVASICNERPAEAEALLSGILRSATSSTNRLHAYRNLQWALNRQQKYSLAIKQGQDAIREFPRDWQLTYNLAVSCAWANEADLFEETARMLRGINGAEDGDLAFRDGVLRYEAARFADQLGTSVESVRRLFDLRDAEAESTR